MKLFIDSANLPDIEAALDRGIVSGVTTNPSLLAREERGDYLEHLQKLVALVRGHHLPVSVEVFTADPEEMLRQAEAISATLAYTWLHIKIPIGWEELRVIAELRRRGTLVNCTCVMSLNQAVLAAAAGANIVSLFYGRIKDTGQDAAAVVRATSEVLRGHPTELLVGSIRHLVDVNEALLAGADIVTIPPQFFPLMVRHPKTDEAVSQFLADFAQWRGVL